MKAKRTYIVAMVRLGAAAIIQLCLLLGRPTSGRASDDERQAKTSANPIFSTTYDCPEWVHDWERAQGDPQIKGMKEGGRWKTRNGSREQITAEANHPG